VAVSEHEAGDALTVAPEGGAGAMAWADLMAAALAQLDLPFIS
jgi:hypothetical protein